MLAGGSGTRLRPITHTSPSSWSRSPTSRCCSTASRRSPPRASATSAIIVGDTAAEIEAAVGDGSAFGLEVTYIRQERAARAGPRRPHRPRLPRRRRLRHVPRRQLHRRRHQRRGGRVPPGPARRPDPAHPGRRPAAVRRRRARRRRAAWSAWRRSPASPRATSRSSGVYLFTPPIHEAVRAIKPSWRGELEITDAIQWLIDQGMTCASTVISGYWKDTGNVTDMLEVNRLVLERLEPASTARWTRRASSSAGSRSRRAPRSSAPASSAP